MDGTFIRMITQADPRAQSLLAAGYYSVHNGWLAVPYEVIHAPRFGMWAAPAMQQRLKKVLKSRPLFRREFLNAPGIASDGHGPPRPFDSWIGQFPKKVRREIMRSRPISEADLATRIVILSPDNKLIGLGSSFGLIFRPTIEMLREPQPAIVRLTLLVGLIATALEDPGRVWPSRKEVLAQHGVEVPGLVEEPLPSVLQTRPHIKNALASMVIRVAMLRALPTVLESVKGTGGIDDVREVCVTLYEWVMGEFFPERDQLDLRDSQRLGGPVDGRREVFSQKMLAFPHSLHELIFERAARSSGLSIQAYRAMVRARLTPHQMCAILMKLWALPPLNDREANQLAVHASRARVRMTRAQQGGDL